MAEPKLQIEQRVDRIEEVLILMLRSQTGFGEFEAREIEKVLRGEKSELSEESKKNAGQEAG
jgi:hypothetical protein